MAWTPMAWTLLGLPLLDTCRYKMRFSHSRENDLRRPRWRSRCLADRLRELSEAYPKVDVDGCQ